jgi:hypothetical protein
MPKKPKSPLSAPIADLTALFGDGPPPWVVNKGKVYEQPCQTLAQANSQRKAVMRKLRWRGKHNGDAAAIALREKLQSCKPAQPCFSGACPICMRAQQRLLVMTTLTHLPGPHPLFGGKRTAISMVPDFGRVPVGGLTTFDVTAFRIASRDALLGAGVCQFLLGLDVSLNHDDGNLDEAYWQFQWWGFFEAPGGPWRERLKALVNASKQVARPVMVMTPDSVEAAAAYGLKSEFKRRVSYVKANLDRSDRGACRNTNDRLLRGEPWVELMIFLDRIGLQRRLLSYGLTAQFQPLMSRNLSNSGGGQ